MALPTLLEIFPNIETRRVPWRRGPLFVPHGGSTAVPVPPGVTLDLSFVAAPLDPSVTFTRASTATYHDATGTLQTAATNTPRFDYDPVTLAPRGLRIEEARTNNVAFATPDATNWTVGNTVLTTAATSAPDGTNTAVLLVDTATSGAHTLQTNASFSYANATAYTFSVYAKQATAWGLQIYTGSAVFGATTFANFNLSNGATGSAGGTGISVSMVNAGNGWWRCTFTCTSTAAASTPQFIMCLTGNNNAAGRGTTYAGTGTGVYLWGAQLEAGAFPTSYIPTVGASVTRAADVATIATIPGRNTAAESFQAEVLLITSQNLNPRIISDTGSQRAAISTKNVGPTCSMYDFAAGLASSNTYAFGTVAKLATTWQSPNNAQVCLNGGPVASATNLTNGFAAIATFKLMADNVAADTANGFIRRFRYWPRALNNAELQQVTT